MYMCVEWRCGGRCGVCVHVCRVEVWWGGVCTRVQSGGVRHVWCEHMCTCDVYMCGCVHVMCTCEGVYMCGCVHVMCTCVGVYM